MEKKNAITKSTEKREMQPNNDGNILRTEIRKYLDGADRYVSNRILLFPFNFLLFGFIWYIGWISLPFFVITLLCDGIDLYAMFRINQVDDKNWMEGDLPSVQQTLVKMRKKRNTRMYLFLPLLTAWAVLFYFDLMGHSPSHFVFTPQIGLSLILVIAISGIVTVIRHKRMQRTLNELIRQLE